MNENAPYKIRIITAASLFDGHDAAINIMRRILQSKGAEIIHLGHNRSAHEIVEAAMEEDAHAIAVTSYQGGHIEFFKYMKDLLEEAGCSHINIFGGGGGTILPQEIEELHHYGIARIYSPDDGRKMGLEGMIDDMLEICKTRLTPESSPNTASATGDYLQLVGTTTIEGRRRGYALGEWRDIISMAQAITKAEAGEDYSELLNVLQEHDGVYELTSDKIHDSQLKKFEQTHRENVTHSEALLWQHLRDRQLNGINFRRRHIIDRFIADFVSLEHKLVVEVEGSIHQLPEHKTSDEERTKRLNELGFHVISVSNNEILHHIEGVKQRILKEVALKNDKAPAQSLLTPPLGKDKQSGSTTAVEGSRERAAKNLILGITGTGGSGKSTVTDEMVRRFLQAFPQKTIAVISVDPSRKKTGGALLGDRIRMNAISSPRVYMRSMATRGSDKALSQYVQDAIEICTLGGYDFIILESAGVGQSDTSIIEYCDLSLYVMTPEYGAASQLEKINMLDYADIIAVNKFDKAGALDALHDVRKQYKRNRGLWNAKDEALPVIGTIASQFNDAGMNELFAKLVDLIKKENEDVDNPVFYPAKQTQRSTIIPANRVRYLSEITETNRQYDQWVQEQSVIASQLYRLAGTLELAGEKASYRSDLEQLQKNLEVQLHPDCQKLLEQWPIVVKKYTADFLAYTVRATTLKQPLTTTSLSGTRLPKIVLPAYKDWGDILRWQLQENVPGAFPYTAGVFELKRQGEDPTRMFAGEGSPERTNKRFHYVSHDQSAKRLSTAFDSVTLYGEDPDYRPDIYGKIGNAGVSIATVEDAKKLYSGFDLCDPKTSVSMTINGPAPIILAFFLNAAIDQQCEQWITTQDQWPRVQELAKTKYQHLPQPIYYNPLSPGRHPAAEGKTEPLGLGLLGMHGDEVVPPDIYQQLKAKALTQVRGTVQADILKEDQAQNTCIFSTEFALKLMGDVQEYFIQQKVQNFYSVSISGYHIAEAGANPITQLAFTLANGFTYVEYYLSRGMAIDDFAPNLSFFFSNGMDPEYSVIGRVARRIWAKAIKNKYQGNERSQKLKYHIQTSGRSLHAQEIDFNDVRTTLQALYAIYDNCNSLHTNAYDEAITTPTEESVRRAIAIQLIINRELGAAKTENYIQGSFAVEELTNLVEEAVLAEFDRITERGGVLGAMERMYQRNKIQEESLHYEHLKHTGELPIVGVNTFLNKKGSPTVLPNEVIRSTKEEKEQQIENLQAFQKRNEGKAAEMLQRLKQAALDNENLFAELMETVKYCSLGQITHALYEVGGQYRRNM